VTWNFSTATSGSSHTLTTPLTVAASGQADNPLVVTLTNDAFMGASAPLACANTYFSMPALTGITAPAGDGGRHHEPRQRQLDELTRRLRRHRRAQNGGQT